MIYCRNILLKLTTSLVFGLATFAAAEAPNSCELVDTLEAFNQSDVSPNGFSCATFKGQVSGQGVACSRAFGYRSEAAELLANRVWDTLKSCRSGNNPSDDQPVNHPDSYLLNTWSTDEGVFRVSIKDKAALESSVVFLSFEEF